VFGRKTASVDIKLPEGTLYSKEVGMGAGLAGPVDIISHSQSI
jgi:hypothetical protein